MRRSERAYLVRPAGGQPVAFVPHPEIPGWWLRCHPSVLAIACPEAGCGARLGEPCRERHGHWRGGEGHWKRRSDAKDEVGRLTAAAAVVFDTQLRLARVPAGRRAVPR